MDIHPSFSLSGHNITPCSDDCVNGYRRADSADDEWHEVMCHNHSPLCCEIDHPDQNVNRRLRVDNQHRKVK